MQNGIDVVYDDRSGSAGEKFADAELLGCPLRLTVGRRTLEDGLVEAQAFDVRPLEHARADEGHGLRIGQCHELHKLRGAQRFHFPDQF